MNNNRDNILIPKIPEISNSLNAIVYRNMNRKFVDKIFEKMHEKRRLPNGKYKYAKAKNERIKLDIKARNLWRTIIIESNKL